MLFSICSGLFSSSFQDGSENGKLTFGWWQHQMFALTRNATNTFPLISIPMIFFRHEVENRIRSQFFVKKIPKNDEGKAKPKWKWLFLRFIPFHSASFFSPALAFYLMNRSPFKWKSLEQFASFLMDANIFRHSVSSISAVFFAQTTHISSILLEEMGCLWHMTKIIAQCTSERRTMEICSERI